MPALVLFGRKWQVGSDDFVISSFVDLVIKLVCLLAGIIIFWKNGRGNIHCPDADYTEILYYGFFTVALCTILLDILLMENSRKGGVMDESPRKYVPLILYFRIGIGVAEIVWTLLATIGMSQGIFHDCGTKTSSGEAEPVLLIHALIIIDWIILSFRVLLFIYMFDTLGRSTRPFDEYRPNNSNNFQVFPSIPLPKTKYTKKWQRRLRCYLCSWCFERDPAILDSHREAAKLFGNGLIPEDIVSTDLIAGIQLLTMDTRAKAQLLQVYVENGHKFQRGQTKYSSDSVSPVINDVSSVHKSIIEKSYEDWQSPDKLRNYVRYTCAAWGYGWPSLVSCSIGKLISNCICYNCSPRRVDGEGDNCCSCCLAGVKTTLGDVPYEDIVFVSFKNSVFAKTFFIALDHKFKTIVIACRGTFSFKDVLTDVTAWPTHIPGFPASYKAHHGILLSCMALRDKLNDMGIIDDLRTKYPEYGLVLTGQSLGSGMSSILSMLLLPKYPDLKCYTYLTPSGLLSHEAAEYCKGHVVSVVYGDDMITRLGILQLDRLVGRIKSALKESKIPKYRLLLGISLFTPTPQLEHILSTPEHPSSQESPIAVEVTINTSNGEEIANRSITNSALRKPIHIHAKTRYPTLEEMYAPGNLFHVVKVQKSERQVGGPKWIWRWADRREFDDFIIYDKIEMLKEHIPFAIEPLTVALSQFS